MKGRGALAAALVAAACLVGHVLVGKGTDALDQTYTYTAMPAQSNGGAEYTYTTTQASQAPADYTYTAMAQPAEQQNYEYTTTQASGTPEYTYSAVAGGDGGLTTYNAAPQASSMTGSNIGPLSLSVAIQ
ncbi:hypothetical protein T484DRAFT_1831159 [Baffinella frigidus]|nr:hypothetical protein T484DRAFT_1831159 [Cryptophyta sp. CCMP2293]